jgi:DNA polymerase-4
MTALCRDCLWMGQDPPSRRCPACASPRLVVHAHLADLSIAHMDCDAFYASVEKRDRPELRDVPVIVGGGHRGVVTTCCYIARMSGVRSAMPMFKALKLCPRATVIFPDFAKYKTASAAIFAKVRALTPLVQPLSLDEAWIDLGGTEALNGGCPAKVLARLQNQIEQEIGLTVSIGLSANKFLAKIASDLDKPRGFAVIGQQEAQAFLAPKPVSILPGVGPALAQSLEKAGHRTVGDLASADAKDLTRRFGTYGLRLWQLAQGQDSRPVNPDQVRKSVSAETTFSTDLSRLDDLTDALWPLCEKVARQMRAAAITGRVATVKLKTADFKLVTRRKTLAVPCQTAKMLFAAGRELLAAEVRGETYRLIGIGLSDLVDASNAPTDFFAAEEQQARATEQVIDDLRTRFGKTAVVTGRSLKPQ